MDDDKRKLLAQLLAQQANLEQLLGVEDFLEDMEEYVLQQAHVNPETLANVQTALHEARNGVLEALEAVEVARVQWDSVRPRGANYGV